MITGSLNNTSGRAYPAFGRDSERLNELELTLRHELGAQTLEEARARGAAMTAEETVSFALHSLGWCRRRAQRAEGLVSHRPGGVVTCGADDAAGSRDEVLAELERVAPLIDAMRDA